LKYLRFFLLSSIGTLLCLFSGCNDAPDATGGGAQPLADHGMIQATTLYATGHSTEKNLIYTSFIDRFMVGKFGTDQAWACLKFSSWPDSLIGGKIVRITSATIQLRSFYHFGDDSISQIAFKLYRATTNVHRD
jgi:hypothetical protein